MEAFYANFILDLFLILSPILYLKFREKKAVTTTREFGLETRPGNWLSEIFLMGKIFFSLLAISILLSILLQLLGVNDLANVENVVRGLLSTNLAILLYFMIVRVFAEEFFFRAFLVPRVGVAASSIVFGLSHLAYGSVAEVIGAIVLGGVLGHFYQKERRLIANFVAHVLYNAAAFALIVAL